MEIDPKPVLDNTYKPFTRKLYSPYGTVKARQITAYRVALYNRLEKGRFFCIKNNKAIKGEYSKQCDLVRKANEKSTADRIRASFESFNAATR